LSGLRERRSSGSWYWSRSTSSKKSTAMKVIITLRTIRMKKSMVSAATRFHTGGMVKMLSSPAWGGLEIEVEQTSTDIFMNRHKTGG